MPTSTDSWVNVRTPKAAITDLRRGVFESKFNREPFYIGHGLVAHPLFSLPRLIELSRFLPATSVEYNAGNLPINQNPDSTPRNGLSVEETIRRIEMCNSWLVLKNVEQHPLYKQLLDECLDSIAEFSETVAPGMTHREGFIFVSSPGSVTPYHIDPEYNFLLQVRGRKKVYLFDGRDRTLLTEREIEAFHAGASRNLVLADENRGKGTCYELEPGQGLHFPITHPHYVVNGPEVSISFSITFRNPESDRLEILYRMNHQLRRFGLAPRPVGQSPRRDALLYSMFRGIRAVKRWAIPGRTKQGLEFLA
ncbi:MAG: cupin-like domain-containing protein [Planctomycetota bacterium]